MKKEARDALSRNFLERLRRFEAEQFALLGLRNVGARDSFVRQLIDSVRRVQFTETIGTLQHSHGVLDPANPIFDPQKAAATYNQTGQFEEACWLAFLSVNCGKHNPMGWRLAAEVYGGGGTKPYWTWAKVSSTPTAFYQWHKSNSNVFTGCFGNHRKYASKRFGCSGYFGDAIVTYADWINSYGNHAGMRDTVLGQTECAEAAFRYLYRDMSCVRGFGRLAKFDYLTLLGKLSLFALEPDSAYISNSTGPLVGARLLVGGYASYALSPKDADSKIKLIGAALGVDSMVMQVMEDAICNWQKSPNRYQRFRG